MEARHPFHRWRCSDRTSLLRFCGLLYRGLRNHLQPVQFHGLYGFDRIAVFRQSGVWLLWRQLRYQTAGIINQRSQKSQTDACGFCFFRHGTSCFILFPSRWQNRIFQAGLQTPPGRHRRLTLTNDPFPNLPASCKAFADLGPFAFPFPGQYIPVCEDCRALSSGFPYTFSLGDIS